MSALEVFSAILFACAAALGSWAATSRDGVSGLRVLAARVAAQARVRVVHRLAGRSMRDRLRGNVLRASSRVASMGRRVQEGRARRRERARCMEELPELIDVVSLGLSAGISFDAALDIYCSKYQTMLSSLLRDAMHSWQLGLSTRRQALRTLSERLGVPAFATFVDTATESLAFGTPLSQALVQQAQAVREERRADVEERIEKAPVKMLIPTGTLILPAMLLAVLGPLLASLASLTG